MSNIIEIDNLNVIFGDTIALKDVQFNVHEKDYIAIMGPNGGGKTTLLRTILGLQKPSSGRVLLFGKEPKNSRSQVGFVPQVSKINRRFPMSVFEAVLTGALKSGFHPFYKYKDNDKDNALIQLKKLGIDHLSNRQLSALSGGEFQRLLIARALMVNPKLLVLDEPTSNVDPSSRDAIYKLLADINKELTIIMVSHDLGAVSSNVKSIVCLNKTLVYHGEPLLTEETVSKIYGCQVDLIAHGLPHRVLANHCHCHEGDCTHA